MGHMKQLEADKAKAKRALRRFSMAAVGYGDVRGQLGLQVRVHPGEGERAAYALEHARLSFPVEVRETFPRARSAANPGRQHNFLGGGRIKSIHPPADPSPRVLQGDARAFWDSVRDDAFEYYSSAGAPKPKKVAERTAWRAVRMHWEAKGRKWVRRSKPLRKPRKMLLPDPGDVIILGKLLEYVWINEDGSLDVRRWENRPPDLYWNRTQKTLYAFPNVPETTVCEPVPDDLADEAQMFKRWSQRDAHCARTFELDAEASIIPMGVGDSIAYRSDKWHGQSDDTYLEDSQEYFHQFSDGNWIWQDSDTSPNAILMRGGQLDVEERGIIH